MGVVLQFAVSFATLLLVVYVQVQWIYAVAALYLGVIIFLYRRWKRIGESRTASGFLITVLIGAIILIPCWGLILRPLPWI